jgi:DNA-binding MarR family transcriptional regulator
MLGADLFGEPVWDLVLDLFIAQAEGRRTCVSSACIGAAVPSTTALRWIKELESRGILQRESDPADARRTFLALAPRFFETMAELLAD